MRLTTVFAMLITATLAASDAYPPPRFVDPGRVAKLQSAMPEIDRLFRAYGAEPAASICRIATSMLPS